MAPHRTPALPGVDELIGVYDADGGVVGELRYALGKVFARRHCALCDLTHHGLRQRADWQRVAREIGVPITLLHRNEMDEEIRAAANGRLPVLLARRSGRLEVVLGPAELDECRGDPRTFEHRLREAVRS